MIQLSDHFNYKHLLRFTMPSIIMLIFTSVYGVVDGFFVSNFVGKTAFTAVNFVIPILLVLGCVGFMFGTGGGALIALTMGSGRKDKANGLFSLLIYASVICGIILTIAGFLFLRPLLSLLGAEGQLLKDCMELPMLRWTRFLSPYFTGDCGVRLRPLPSASVWVELSLLFISPVPTAAFCGLPGRNSTAAHC